jgi:pimeloyl-ACP methyl ester carboxylesterase
MIHGAFAGGWSFDALRGHFESRGFACHAPDLRHHGAALKPGIEAQLATTSMLDYAADLCALIDGLSQPPLVIGHSMGGLLAQMLATRRPLKGMVLLAPSAPWGVLSSSLLEMIGAQALLLNGALWEQAVFPIYQIAAEFTLDRLTREERHEAFERLGPESGRAVFETVQWALDPNRATFVFPREVSCPVLTLVGAQDRVNPPETVRRVARRYRHRSTYAVLGDMSHWLLTEPGWENLAVRIEDWIGTLDQG